MHLGAFEDPAVRNATGGYVDAGTYDLDAGAGAMSFADGEAAAAKKAA